MMVAEALLSGVAETVVGFLLEQGSVSLKARLGLARDPITVAFDTALHRAVAETFAIHQDYDGDLFHATFLKYEGAPLLAAMLTPDDTVTGADFAAAWADRPPAADNRDELVRWMTPVCATFLARLRHHLRAHPALLAFTQAQDIASTRILTQELARLQQQQIEALGQLNAELPNLQKQQAAAIAKLNQTIRELLSVPTLLRTINNTLLSSIQQLSFTYSTRIRNFTREYIGDGENKIPFGGRDAAWKMLNAWLADPEAPACLLLTAEAGRGKSALLVRWSMFLEKYTDVEVVFVPISIRFETGTEEVFYAALAARLAAIHGDTLKYQQLTADQWQGVFHEYISRPLPAHKRIVVVIDGADETTGRPLGAGFLPLPLPDNVRVVVSARVKAGEGAKGWIRQLGWHLRGTARSETLRPLDQSGVREVLTLMGNPLDGLATRVGVVAELYRLTKGDPLLLRLYVDALVGQKALLPSLSAEELQHLQPGLQGYFDQWWEDQERLWEARGDDPRAKQKEVKAFLYAVAISLGPLHKDDVLGVLGGDLDRLDITSMAKEVERFVIGDGMQQGYSFSHPRLGYYFADRLNQKQKESWNQRFVVHGHAFLREIRAANKLHWTPEELSVAAYRIQHYATHLDRVKTTPEQFYGLICREWAQAWEKVQGTYDGFLGDVERVEQHAAKDTNSIRAITMHIKCALSRSSIVGLSSNISPELLVTATRFGGLNPTQTLVLLKQYSSANQAIAVTLLVEHFSSNEEFITQLLGMTVVQGALEGVNHIADEGIWVKMLVALAPHLPQEVLQVTHKLSYEGRRAEVLVALAPHLPRRVLQVAHKISDERRHADVLVALAPYLSQEVLQMLHRLSYEGRRVQVLMALAPFLPQGVLEAASKISDKVRRARILVAIAPHLPPHKQAPVLHAALEVALRIADEGEKVTTLAALAPYLPQEVLQVTHKLSYEGRRAEVLVALAPHLPRRVLQVAHKISDERRHADVLVALAPYLSQEVLQMLHRLSYEGRRVQVLMALAPFLQREVFQTLPNIINERNRTDVLVTLAPHLPPQEQASVVQGLLEVAHQISYEGEKLRILVALAPYLSQPLQVVYKLFNEEMWERVLVTLAPSLQRHKQAPMLQAALEASRKIVDEVGQAEVLVALIPYLQQHEQEDVVERVLDAAHKIIDEESQVRLLVALALYLPQDVLEAVRKIAEEGKRVAVIVALAPQIPQEVLKVLHQMTDERYQAEVLVALAPHLSQGVLEAIHKITDAERRARILVALAPQLPQEVLKVLYQMTDDRYWAEVLAALLPHLLPHEQAPALQAALEAARKIANGGNQVKLLATLAPHLPPHKRAPVLHAALEATYQLHDERNRTEVLVALAPLLPQEVLKIAPKIITKRNRTEILVALAPHLPQEVLEIGHKIIDEGNRTKVLVALAPHLPQEVLVAVRKIFNKDRQIPVLTALACHIDEHANLLRNDSRNTWRTIIETLAYYPRPTLLPHLTSLMPFTLALADNTPPHGPTLLLTADQTTQLIRYLHLPYVDLPTVDARRNFLTDAGLSDLEPYLTLQGDQDTFVHALVRLVQDRNLAGDLIRYLKDSVTGHADLQAWAADLLGTTPLTPRQELARGILDVVQEVCAWWP